jgi:hypothetical protein
MSWTLQAAKRRTLLCNTMKSFINIPDTSVVILCIDGDVRVLECQYQESADVKEKKLSSRS